MSIPWEYIILVCVIGLVIVIILVQTKPDNDQTENVTRPKPLIPAYMRQPDLQKDRLKKNWIKEFMKNIQYLECPEYPAIGAEFFGVPTREPDAESISVGRIIFVEPTSSNSGRTFRVLTDLSPSSLDGVGRTPFMVNVTLDT